MQENCIKFHFQAKNSNIKLVSSTRFKIDSGNKKVFLEKCFKKVENLQTIFNSIKLAIQHLYGKEICH